MGKNNKKRPPLNENDLHLPKHPSASSSSSVIVDNHTHLLSTFAAYRQKFPAGKYETVFEFAKSLYRDLEGDRHVVRSIIDVWCEAPVRKEWKELADSAVTEEQRAQNWLGMDYHFVMGELKVISSSHSELILPCV
jgi:TatD DNase family protein